MNIKIYKLITEEYQAGKMNIQNSSNSNNHMDYNIWREMAYYEYIREYIIKRKECPNFASMYGFYIAEKCMIDFDKIKSFRGEGKIDQPMFIPENQINKGTGLRGVPSIPSGPSGYSGECNELGPITNVDIANVINKSKQQAQKFLGKTPPPFMGNNMVPNPEAYTGKAIVALTESPFYNIFGWASKTYQVEGNVKRMINTGVHQEAVWHSIVFQMMSALYSLQIHGIVFNNFNIEDNIYVKDLSLHGNITSYWKYKIDGIDYYIPNYGYLVMFDSSYKDIESNQGTFIKQQVAKHKVIGKPFGDQIKDADVKKLTFDMFKSAVNSNVYNQTFINNGGCEPPAEIKKLFDSITDSTSRDTMNDVGTYIYKFMRRFINNRVGTYLKETEVTNVRKDDIKEYKKGQMVILEEASNTYKFVMYIGENKPGVSLILTRDEGSKDIVDKLVPVSSLYGYSKMEPIMQTFKPTESNMNDDDLLETYIINSS
jgi:hypothetical protein